MLRSFFVVCFLVLAGCGNREAVLVAPDAAEYGTVYKTFVATTRQRQADGWFSDGRRSTPNYLESRVSVPPEHTTGRIRQRLNAVNPETDFAMVGKKDFDSEGDFVAGLRSALHRVKPSERDVLIYVHGYNNSFAEGVFRTVQMQHDFALPGVAVHFSWPSAANALGYAYDQDSVLISRNGFEQTLRNVVRAKPRRIILVAHSLGSLLTLETLRQIEIADPGWSRRHLGGVVLISPDLDVELFQTQAAQIATLPDPFVIFTSQRDRALRLSAQINGDKERLGTLKDPEIIGDYPVTVIDVSEFQKGPGLGHFTVGNSPMLIQLLSQSQELNQAFDGDRAGRSGLLQGTVINARNATHMILSPLLIADQR